MRNSKKFISILLAALMAVSMIPFSAISAFAATGVANGAELKAAIAAAQDGDVIEFTADNTTYPATSGALVIPVDGKDITLDLKGHTQYFRVSGETTVSYPTDLFVLKNGAKLTIIDTVGTGALYATYGGNSAAYIFNVTDSSELVINGGTFVMDQANYGGVIVYQNDATASTTINDGEFTANTGAKARRDYLINNTRGEVEINGGEFTTARTFDYVINEGNTTDTTLTINNGEFNGTMSLDVTKATTTLNGGTYKTYDGSAANTDVSAYLPADQIIDSTTGEIKNVDPSTVARTNSAEFTSLKDALDSVAAGATATITLLDDCTLSATYEIADNQKITIDLNGNDITTTARAFNIRHGQLTLKGTGNLNANFTGANAAVAVYGAATDQGSNYSTFTQNSTVTINAANGYGAMIGATSGAAYGAKLQLNGTINSKYGVYINGNVAEPNVKTNAAAINITGTVTASNENAVVYAAGYAKWNISSNANLTGGSGVYIKSGTMNIYGNAVITATGAKTAYAFNSNGADGTGDAIIIDSCGYPGNVPTVTIKAGTITSANGAAVASYAKQDDPRYPDAEYPRVDNVIPGTSTAVFSSNVTALAADDYKTVYDAEKGGYVIAPIAYGTAVNCSDAEATITGNATSHTVITLDGATLNFASADSSVGRYYDGYYFTVKFVAPEGTNISQDARYTNGSVDSTTGQLKIKNLYNAKDGANFMYSWPYVTVESVEAAVAAGVNKEWNYTFDWDGDGFFEQAIDIVIVPNTVTLVKNGEQMYPAFNDNAANFTLGNDIKTNIYFDKDYPETYTAKITYNHNSNTSQTSDVRTDTVAIGDLPTYSGSDETYVDAPMFSVVQAPAQISEPINVVIMNGNLEVDSFTIVPSVRCAEQAAATTGTLKALYESVLDYGKAAQDYFDYTSDPIETNFIEDVEGAVIPSTGGSSSLTTLTGVSMVVTSDLGVNIYTSELPTGVSISGPAGVTAQAGENGGRYFIAIRGINAADLDTNFTVTTDQGAITLSAYTVARSVAASSSNVEYQLLAKAMYLYGAAADAYFV